MASRGKAAGGAGIVSSSNIVGSESTGMSDLSDFVGRESTSSSTSIKQECLQDHIRCEASIIADGFTRSASSITEVTLIGSAFVAFWNRRCSSQVPETTYPKRSILSDFTREIYVQTRVKAKSRPQSIMILISFYSLTHSLSK